MLLLILFYHYSNSLICVLGIGAWMSQKMAAFLEENELFVPEDDDDDDD